MRSSRSTQRYILFILTMIVIACGGAVYLVIKNVVAEQSSLQQKSIMPVLALVVDELIQPLHVAETLAHDRYLLEILQSPSLDEKRLINHLDFLQRQHKQTLVMSAEPTYRQYSADGTTINLDPNTKASWYPDQNKVEHDVYIGMGKQKKLKVFVEVPVLGAQQKFLGYLGVSRLLSEFLASFEYYKQQYGHDLVFVNPNDYIVMATLPNLMGDARSLRHLTELEWYQDLNGVSGHVDLDGQIIQRDGQTYLLSQILVNELNWRLLVLTPLEDRQATLTNQFLIYFVSFVLALLLTVYGVYLLLNAFARKVAAEQQYDALTGLANRTRLERRFGNITKKSDVMSLVITDIDHFKKVNDQHGHNAGDNVIIEFSDTLLGQVRELDLVCRWGGEEFIILLPSTSLEAAIHVAERFRRKVEQLKIEAGQSAIQITASFGVTEYVDGESLSTLVERADSALYQAKENGRNRVCHSSD